MDTEKLAATFIDLADTLVDDFDVLDLLYVLVTRCEELWGLAAAGLLLSDDQNRLRVAVASNESARLLEIFQIQYDEGPCLECYHTGGPVSANDLDSADGRWPRFAPAATAAGFVAVHALPMRLRGEVIGALNLFSDSRVPPISEQEIPIAQALADVATIAILQDRLARSRETLAEQLQGALNSRIAIEQAKGALALHLGINPEQAFELLRERARSTRRRLTEVAAEVVQRTLPDASWSKSEKPK
ncbi:MAG TPA: GAF and ANTAR domain-containing protein [Nocardioidaceae bacterium]|nr:GAF and ANTAR domain-containing protein [Nocardioidaceae bacterium]